VQRTQVKLADDIDHEPRHVALVDAVTHADRHQEQPIALGTHAPATTLAPPSVPHSSHSGRFQL
jgi:hypothetical protein